jgi:hypothetical protein
VDLNRLEQFSRERLEAEARRIGVHDAHLLTRAELIVAILRDGAGLLRPLREARKFLGALAETARELKKLTRARPASPTVHRTKQAPTPFVPSAVHAPVAPSVTHAPSAPNALDLGRNLRSALQTASEEPVVGRPTPATDGESGVEKARAATRSFVSEPIRTHSMARLLAAQGHVARALAIYDELIAKDPTHAVLLEEAERLRRGLPPSAAPAVLPTPGERAHVLPTTADDHVSCTAGELGTLRIRWNTSEAGRSRAATLLGESAELALRVVLVMPDRDRVVQSVITEHGPVESHGEWTATLDAGAVGQRCVASVGMRARDRFVSIAHARADQAT